MSKKDESWYRNFVLSTVDQGIENISFFAEILVIVNTWALIKDDNTMVWGITLLLLGTSVIFLSSWLFFCIIDARNLLKQIAENSENVQKKEIKIENDTPIEPAPIVLATDEKYCSNCNAIIKKVAKKCRYCGTWIDNNGGNE